MSAHPRPVGLRAHRARLSASIGAPGPHDFAVRVGVALLRANVAHENRPAIIPARAPPPRPSHSLSSVRDDAYAPHQGRNANTIRLMLVLHEAIYFSREDWTGRFGLMRLGIFDFSRRRSWGAKSLARRILALR